MHRASSCIRAVPVRTSGRLRELTNSTIRISREMSEKTLCLPVGLLLFGLLDLSQKLEDRLSLLESSPKSSGVFSFGRLVLVIRIDLSVPIFAENCSFIMV